MNSYELSRAWFDWCFQNPEKITTSHTALYFFAIEHCNRLGWKEKFGFPSQMVMEALGIKSWKTYTKIFNEVIEFGFIELIQKSTNQYSSNIIKLAYVKNTNPTTNPLDKALRKHVTKQVQSIDSIIKQLNNEQLNNEQIESLKLIIEKYKDGKDEKPKGDKFKQFYSEKYLQSVLDVLKDYNTRLDLESIKIEADKYVRKIKVTTDTSKEDHDYYVHFFNTMKKDFKKSTNGTDRKDQTEAERTYHNPNGWK